MLAVLISVTLSQAVEVPPAVQQPPVEVIAPQQPRRICRIERDTGSHVGGRRVCQTVQEREQERDEQQRNAAEGVNRQWDRTQGDIPFSPFALPFGTRIRHNDITSGGLRRFGGG